MSQRPTPPLFLRPEPPPSDSPFHEDLFQRKELADRLTGYLSRLPNGGVFAIDAPWGEGKSWFGRNWAASLEAQGFTVIYLDAFERDYVTDPFVVITGELLEAIKSTEPAVRRTVLDAGKKLGKILLPAAARVAVNAASRMAIGRTDVLEDVARIAESIHEGVADALEKQVEKQLETYETEKRSVERFRAALSELPLKHEKPIVCFIDELDRCRPDFAVRMIERVKHFFEVPGFVFVLLLNSRQLAESVKGVYGEGLDADAYLGKFIQFFLTLPKSVAPSAYGMRDHNLLYCKRTLERYGFPANDATESFAWRFGSLAGLMGLSLRDIERGVVLYSLAQPVNNAAPFLAWPIALKIGKPRIFQRVLGGTAEGHSQAKEFLGSIRASSPEPSFIQLFEGLHEAHSTGNFDGLSDEVKQSLRSVRLMHIQVDRFLPWLCERIDLTVRN